jgi:ribosomal protein L6P/L9E
MRIASPSDFGITGSSDIEANDHNDNRPTLPAAAIREFTNPEPARRRMLQLPGDHIDRRLSVTCPRV